MIHSTSSMLHSTAECIYYYWFHSIVFNSILLSLEWLWSAFHSLILIISVSSMSLITYTIYSESNWISLLIPIFHSSTIDSPYWLSHVIDTNVLSHSINCSIGFLSTWNPHSIDSTSIVIMRIDYPSIWFHLIDSDFISQSIQSVLSNIQSNHYYVINWSIHYSFNLD